MSEDFVNINKYLNANPEAKADWISNFMTCNNPRMYIGIDWAAGHGMIRGEVIKRRDNVVYVRFRTVTA